MNPNNLNLDRRLETLSHRGRVAFAATCCERLLPNYEAYAEVYEANEISTLRALLNHVWEFASGQSLSKSFDALLKRSQDIAMESETALSNLFSQALDAVDATTTTAECCLEDKKAKYLAVAQACFDSMHSYLYWVNDADLRATTTDISLDEMVDSLPLMKREVDVMLNAIEQLKGHELVSRNFREQLIQVSMSAGIQPRLRGLFFVRMAPYR